jgi:hypothetical protein
MLQRLDVKYGDPVVREFAVRQLDRLNDSQLNEVMLQLTQVLKYEPDHDSPLARMLLRRAVRAPLRLGQTFFWMLRSEMHVHCINDRYGLLLKLYLQRCGPHKTTLSRQLFINESLTSIAQVSSTTQPPHTPTHTTALSRTLTRAHTHALPSHTLPPTHTHPRTSVSHTSTHAHTPTHFRLTHFHPRTHTHALPSHTRFQGGAQRSAEEGQEVQRVRAARAAQA